MEPNSNNVTALKKPKRPERRIPPALLPINNACDYTGLGRTRMYELLKNQEISAVRIGGRTLIRRDSLDALIERSPSFGTAA